MFSVLVNWWWLILIIVVLVVFRFVAALGAEQRFIKEDPLLDGEHVGRANRITGRAYVTDGEGARGVGLVWQT